MTGRLPRCLQSRTPDLGSFERGRSRVAFVVLEREEKGPEIANEKLVQTRLVRMVFSHLAWQQFIHYYS